MGAGIQPVVNPNSVAIEAAGLGAVTPSYRCYGPESVTAHRLPMPVGRQQSDSRPPASHSLSCFANGRRQTRRGGLDPVVGHDDELASRPVAFEMDSSVVLDIVGELKVHAEELVTG